MVQSKYNKTTTRSGFAQDETAKKIKSFREISAMKNSINSAKHQESIEVPYAYV